MEDRRACEEGERTNGSTSSNDGNDGSDVGDLEHGVRRTLEQNHGDLVLSGDKEGSESGGIRGVAVDHFL